MAARGFLGAGDLYIARIVGGVQQGLIGPYEATKFEIKPKSELKELVSKGRTTYGQIIESVPVPKPADLNVDLTEVNKESLAIALFGTVSVLAQASGSWATSIDLPAKHDEWAALPKAKLLTLVVKDPGATITYVEGVDYLVNKEMGWVKPLVGGAIAASVTLKITGTYDTIAGYSIAGMTTNQVRCKFILHGKNFADDLPCIVTIYEAVISADQAFDFLKNDFNTVGMTGRMKTPTGYTEPFTVALRSA
jgi:hypothetical protein